MIQFSLHMIPSMISGAETPMITASSVRKPLNIKHTPTTPKLEQKVLFSVVRLEVHSFFLETAYSSLKKPQQ